MPTSRTETSTRTEDGSRYSPACPTCGRQVFNRRYPKCEFCGAVLPDGIVFSSAERKALFEADRVAAEEAWRIRKLEEELEEKLQRDRGG